MMTAEATAFLTWVTVLVDVKAAIPGVLAAMTTREISQDAVTTQATKLGVTTHLKLQLRPRNTQSTERPCSHGIPQ